MRTYRREHLHFYFFPTTKTDFHLRNISVQTNYKSKIMSNKLSARLPWTKTPLIINAPVSANSPTHIH
jgi:hypothetical protein